MTTPTPAYDDPAYPVGELMECYQCPDAVYDMPIMQPCVALGPVTKGFDPTQTYRLACGHTAI